MPEITSPNSYTGRSSIIFQGPQKPYAPAPREPYRLPRNRIQLPGPGAKPQPPQPINWIAAILPPVLMVLVMGGITAINASQSGQVNYMMLASTLTMPMIFPIVNIFSANASKRKYRQDVELRAKNYEQTLTNERDKLLQLASKQRSILETEYPRLSQLIDIALAKGTKDRLWNRLPEHSDFLSLRIGKSKGEPSFTVTIPNQFDPTDELASLSMELVQNFEEIPDLPYLIDIKKIGSLAIAGSNQAAILGAARKLILEICVHHSPKDIQLMMLSDHEEAIDRWRWIKWLPHTRALTEGNEIRQIAFTKQKIDECKSWIIHEYDSRRGLKSNYQAEEDCQTSIVAFIDDRGRLRQDHDLQRVVERGFEVGIFIIILGERNLPRIRARLDVSDQGSFRYVETVENGAKKTGSLEIVDQAEMEACARGLAQLTVMGEKSEFTLPEKVRLTQVLQGSPVSIGTSVLDNWSIRRSDRELLQFPIGLCVSQEGLTSAMINLLPQERGGVDAYHTVLIGTTGSGKSEFLKSWVLGAAFQYSPDLISFFFLDFKGGAAFDPFKSIPHTVGVVTNLKPELVDRGLDAIRSEIERRQREFAKCKVRDIWQYNKSLRDAPPMSHMLLFLDEFAKGIEDFPQLPDILQLLVRQGRSLGMYLILANQNINSQVESLLNNVGWRIALRVAKDEEMTMIKKELRSPRRSGQGYLRLSAEEIQEFQAGYAGFPVAGQAVETSGEFKIHEISPDGETSLLYQYSPIATTVATDNQDMPSEQDDLIEQIQDAAQELSYKPAKQIYLDPLPVEIQLDRVLENQATYRSYEDHKWSDIQAPRNRAIIPIGYEDLQQECEQRPLSINFNEKDGHLWIVGQPGSGKAQALVSLVTSIAQTHTPEEAIVYILELSSSGLKQLEILPHVGAVILPGENERLDRLFTYLEQEIQVRTMEDSYATGHLLNPKKYTPDIYLIINNFVEILNFVYFQEEYSERVQRIITNGKAARIHLVISANHGRELSSRISGNIDRRIALQMLSTEYSDITGKMLNVLPVKAPGRGYYKNDSISECQVALAAPRGVDEKLQLPREIMFSMRENWKGALPKKIEILPACIPLSDGLSRIDFSSQSEFILRVPIGISYDTLDWITPNLMDEIHQWLILGPQGFGKRNFLASVVASVLRFGSPSWEVKVFTIGSAPIFNQIPKSPNLRIFSTKEAIQEESEALAERLRSSKDHRERLLLVLSNLGRIFDPGWEKAAAAINNLAPELRDRSDVVLMASSTTQEIQSRFITPIGSLLRQSGTGICFIRSGLELEWFNVPITSTTPYRKVEWGVGRAYFISAGRATLVQTPRFDAHQSVKD